MAEVTDAGKALQAEEEEHRRRAEIRRQAEAELAAFNEKRKQEIEARREKNRAEQAAREGCGYGAGAPAAATPFASEPGAAAGLQALMGGLAGSGSGGMEAMIKAALANPAVAAAVQQAATSQTRPSEPPAQSCLAVRVREVTAAEASSGAFRRVVLRPATGGASGPVPFKEVESLVAAKFATNRRPDGSEVGLRPLVSLVRVADGLQVGDDEDVEELRDGDELQATFAQPCNT
eukprot:TRINITY_DN64731_c0_g1_i1.p1 TRINITY_DN64731_c0_g1~~TRINITY_DN64731_c0_g1_i1.p1  ORF type:complete len:234 (+),score=68.00 TRINITY_DN64731_c0_g1_i1:188-889(+)